MVLVASQPPHPFQTSLLRPHISHTYMPPPPLRYDYQMTQGLLASLRQSPLLLVSADTTVESLGRVLNAWTQVRGEEGGGGRIVTPRTLLCLPPHPPPMRWACRHPDPLPHFNRRPACFSGCWLCRRP